MSIHLHSITLLNRRNRICPSSYRNRPHHWHSLNPNLHLNNCGKLLVQLLNCGYAGGFPNWFCFSTPLSIYDTLCCHNIFFQYNSALCRLTWCRAGEGRPDWHESRGRPQPNGSSRRGPASDSVGHGTDGSSVAGHASRRASGQFRFRCFRHLHLQLSFGHQTTVPNSTKTRPVRCSLWGVCYQLKRSGNTRFVSKSRQSTDRFKMKSSIFHSYLVLVVNPFPFVVDSWGTEAEKV